MQTEPKYKVGQELYNRSRKLIIRIKQIYQDENGNYLYKTEGNNVYSELELRKNFKPVTSLMV